jgi:hypothetical protein
VGDADVGDVAILNPPNPVEGVPADPT